MVALQVLLTFLFVALLVSFIIELVQSIIIIVRVKTKKRVKTYEPWSKVLFREVLGSFMFFSGLYSILDVGVMASGIFVMIAGIIICLFEIYNYYLHKRLEKERPEVLSYWAEQ